MPVSENPSALRQQIRSGALRENTSGLAPGFVQCNIVILPADAAQEFAAFCSANPKPCPLLATGVAGDPALPELGDIDIRTDVPRYRVFEHGELVREIDDINTLWRDDFVTFALGCSFSFEEALIDSGLEVRNVTEGVNVPMYNTNIVCTPIGQFSANMVVSMRPFAAADAIRAIEISSKYPAVHGAPVHLGDPNLIGISSLATPDYGERVSVRENDVPLFWACGVTPQVALNNARLPLAITHSPGCMLITDKRNSELTAWRAR